MLQRISRQIVRLSLSIVALASLGSALSGAQDLKAAQPRTPRVPLDRNSGAVGVILPFDEPFILVGAAGTTLLKLEVWYADSMILSRSKCESLVRPDLARQPKGNAHTPKSVGQWFGIEPRVDTTYSDWTRVRPGSDSFWVSIATPLPPNRNYTFCLRSREALSPDDSARFQALVVSLVRDAVRKSFVAGATNTSMGAAGLTAFQKALIDALPPETARRSKDIAPGSIFDVAAPSKVLQDVFVELANYDLTRRYTAEAVERLKTGATPNGPRSLRQSIEALASDPALPRLSNAAIAAAKLGESQERRLQAAVAVAATLASLRLPAARGQAPGVDGVAAAAIAIGQVPITSPRFAAGGIVGPAESLTAGQLSQLIANMDTTVARLQGLAELVVWIGAGDTRMRAGGIAEREDLYRLALFVQQTMDDAAAQGANLRQLQATIATFDTATIKLASAVVARDVKSLGLVTTTSGSYETRARWHISQDLGVLYAWPNKSQGVANDVAGYLGVNFYLRPVNKRAPMRVWNPLDLRRWSGTLGVTAAKIEEQNRYSGVLGGKALVVGAGFRLTDFFRLSYGTPVVWTYSEDSARRKRVTGLKYVSVSIDAELKELLGQLADALSK